MFAQLREELKVQTDVSISDLQQSVKLRLLKKKKVQKKKEKKKGIFGN